ncbi:GNAT family N-acetyltransferase [Paenibacillus lycopersici]|uniref:GNAT family N-acetyltransferase n=1 Tax=Paenibacillus lycopersici TaxID=2704462 RepID=A0A6C0FYQ4_9BACL|nr:GNAT family N-acetyltransferase [Paenibacillus lycopersici]QHT61212.1 GNAT family N-acetyltransferase [Paenibacillus lycopersici]
MGDMLVKLYQLPESESAKQFAERTGITVRRAIGPELVTVAEWIEKRFGKGWRSETEIAFARQPVACLIAVKDGELLGFACYDATCRGFFGPTGVDEQMRGLGIGKQLLFEALHAMRDYGYAYGIIGGAGPVDFYRRAVGAVEIEQPEPGIYSGMLKLV